MVEIALQLFGVGLEESTMEGSDLLDKTLVGGTELSLEFACRKFIELHLNVLFLFEEIKHVVDSRCRIVKGLYAGP